MMDENTEDQFDETTYLRLHKDVRDAVARGDWQSGREHYEKVGASEGRRLKSDRSEAKEHFIRDYTDLIKNLIKEHPGDYDLAMAKAVGSPTHEAFVKQGSQQVDMLRRLGLCDGMRIYDLACGSGRTAQALQAEGWSGQYKGADIIPELVEHLRSKCPGFDVVVHTDLSIDAVDSSIDMIYAWSLFTHLLFEETYIYAEDAHRALKSGGWLIFSFLEFDIPTHWAVFNNRLEMIKRGENPAHLDIFLHRGMIAKWAERLGYDAPVFIDGNDVQATTQGPFGQSVAALRKN